MKFLSKNIMVVGAMALTLTLFSFKSADSNEVNMGETVVYQQTKSYDQADILEAARIRTAKKVAEKVVEGAKELAKKAWDESGKEAAKFVAYEVILRGIDFILSADQPFGQTAGIVDYKMGQL